MMKSISSTWSFLLFLHAAGYHHHHHRSTADAFVVLKAPYSGRVNPNIVRLKLSGTDKADAVANPADANISTSASGTGNAANDEKHPTAVRVPLKYLGPYPCLALRFPNLATQSQRQRNVTGVSLDFVLDTAANTNTIQAQVAQELELEVVGEALPGVGAAGAISGGDTYMLGDTELDGLPKEEAGFTFMQGLTASALPVASPAAAGLLGLYFFNCFQGGVMFDWDGSNSSNANDSAESAVPPSVTFYSDKSDMVDALDGLHRVPIKSLPVSSLPSIELEINGRKVPALLDTGSPITVLNAEAARLTGVQTTMEVEESGRGEKNLNPFVKLIKGLQSAQAAAQGNVLLVAGAAGERIELVKSQGTIDVGVGGGGDDDDDDAVPLGEHNVYVGDLPGLAALGGLGGSGAPPAAVLGMDILRTRPRMVYRVDEVYL